MKDLINCYHALPESGHVLDVGCLGFNQHRLGNSLYPGKFHYSGVDYIAPDTIPEKCTFKRADLNEKALPFDDDQFDLVVAKHVIEHLKDPLVFFGECLRVCKPGGSIYFEAPSERSLLLPGMPFQHEKFYSLSFFDDPTHMSRPWSPAAFYRLSCLFSATPLKTGYITSWKCRLAFPFLFPLALLLRQGKLLERLLWGAIGWASFLIVQKPQQSPGKLPFCYYVPPR